MSDTVADDLIQSGYRRWLQLEEAKAEIADDLKELMAELKSHGLVPKALRESFRRVRDQDNADKQEHDAMVDLYVASLTRGTRAYTRENSKIEGEQTHLDRGTPAAPSMQGGQTNPHSSLLSSSAAETKAGEIIPPPVSSATPSQSEAA